MEFGDYSKISNSEESVGNHISLENTGGSIVATTKTEVRFTKEQLEDSLVFVRRSELEKARKLLENEASKKEGFPWGEIMLAVATTLLGVSLSSWASLVSLATPHGVFAYCVCPALTVGLFIGFLWFRSAKSTNLKLLAERVLDHLEDPNISEVNAHEH